MRHGSDRRVYFVVAVSLPDEPGVTIGLAAGRQAPDGRLTTDILVNDVEGSDRRPGFHQIGYDEAPRPRRCPPSATSSGRPSGSSARWTVGRSTPGWSDGVSTSR
ncbi:hypothetical protein NKG94_13425 [Micromonospora sp. M12]